MRRKPWRVGSALNVMLFRENPIALLSAKSERLDDLESRFQADLDNIGETFKVQYFGQF
jgi:hypothetical protein